jgi:Spy/CpxP family protein refolding chaperone
MTGMRRIKPVGMFALAMAVGVVGAGCEDKASTAPGASGSASAAASASAAPATSGSAAAAASGSASPAASAEPSEEDKKKLADENDQLNLELESHHRHNHAGFAGLVMDAVETLGVTADQEATIDKIKGEFHKKMKPVREANKAVINLLADGVAAGKIDTAKVDAAVAKATADSTAAHGATDDLLNDLHKALKPEQRVALVDKLDAQWAVWKEANAGVQAVDNGKPDGHLTHLAKELSLTDDQVAKVKASLDGAKDAKKPFDTAAADTHFKEFSAAFGAEGFDAKKLAAATAEGPHLVQWGAARMARFYEALTPVLTPDQRTKVADKLRQRASDPKSKEAKE